LGSSQHCIRYPSWIEEDPVRGQRGEMEMGVRTRSRRGRTLRPSISFTDRALVQMDLFWFLANVNSCSRSLYVVVRPSVVCRLSVVCNFRAPYSSDWNFRQCFYAIWYLGHLWPFGNNFTEIVPWEPLCRGVTVGGLNQRGVEKCSAFGPFQGYISETVQDRR